MKVSLALVGLTAAVLIPSSPGYCQIVAEPKPLFKQGLYSYADDLNFESSNSATREAKAIRISRQFEHGVLSPSIQYLQPGSGWDNLLYVSAPALAYKVEKKDFSPWDICLSEPASVLKVEKMGFHTLGGGRELNRGIDWWRTADLEGSRLHDWFEAIQNSVGQFSTADERNLENKTVSCVFSLSLDGHVKDLRIDQSSGREDIDKKALKLIQDIYFRDFTPPPDTRPFYGIKARYSEKPFISIDLQPHQLSFLYEASTRRRDLQTHETQARPCFGRQANLVTPSPTSSEAPHPQFQYVGDFERGF